MALFDEVYNDLLTQKQRKLDGKYNGIPFPFPRFREYIPEIEKGSYIGILGASGIGKSKLTRFIAVYNSIDFALKHNYPIKILYFALEDPKKKVFKNIICHYLAKRHNYQISLTQLESKGDFILPKDAQSLIEKDTEFFKSLNKMLYIMDDCVTPGEIEERCDEIKEKLSEETHVIVIIDNYSNLVPPKGMSDWEAVRYFSRNIARLKLCKEYGWSTIAVLQQDLESEKYTFRQVASGRMTAGSIEPTAASIGDSKIVIRDFFYAIGLINPWRYEITHYPNHKGYDINILRNKARFLNIFKSNESEQGGRLGLYFGNSEMFSELPRIDNEAELKILYKYVLEKEKSRFNQKNLFNE